jgi:hypothetical protein
LAAYIEKGDVPDRVEDWKNEHRYLYLTIILALLSIGFFASGAIYAVNALRASLPT